MSKIAQGRAWLVAGLLSAGLLAGCASYQPKAYTADDRCRGCSGSGGLFTGEDGVLEVDVDL
jgi:hypothetical protein